MSNINFDLLFQNIESGVETLGKTTLQDYFSQAKKDGQNAVAGMKVNLQNWSAEVAQGSLTIEDVNFLLKAETSLTEMDALKEVGLAAIRIETFKIGIINVVTGAIANFIKV